VCVGVCAGAGGTPCAGRPGKLVLLLDQQSGRPGTESLTPVAVGRGLEGAQEKQ
jgi:hypothetical protein